jgi:hypothetical protein
VTEKFNSVTPFSFSTRGISMIDPETGFPVGFDAEALRNSPFRPHVNDPRASVPERTRRELATRPELWEHMAFNLWRYEGNGPSDGLEAIHAWNKMSDPERENWITRAKQEQEEYLRRWESQTPPDDPDGGEPVPIPKVG